MRVRQALYVLPLLFGVACLGPSEPIPLSVSAVANPTTANVGAVVDIVVTARGAGIGVIHAQFGDGTDEVFPAGGANSTTVTFPHAYESAGTFHVLVTASDTRGSKATTTSVTVVAP
jgi:PKD repeat protein